MKKTKKIYFRTREGYVIVTITVEATAIGGESFLLRSYVSEELGGRTSEVRDRIRKVQDEMLEEVLIDSAYQESKKKERRQKMKKMGEKRWKR